MDSTFPAHRGECESLEDSSSHSRHFSAILPLDSRHIQLKGENISIITTLQANITLKRQRNGNHKVRSSCITTCFIIVPIKSNNGKLKSVLLMIALLSEWERFGDFLLLIFLQRSQAENMLFTLCYCSIVPCEKLGYCFNGETVPLAHRLLKDLKFRIIGESRPRQKLMKSQTRELLPRTVVVMN